MGLSNDPTCKKCGMEEETSVHILFECEALASFRHAHMGSFFLDPEDIMSLSRGVIWNFGKGTGLLYHIMGHRGPLLRPRCTRPGRVRTQVLFCSLLSFYA